MTVKEVLELESYRNECAVFLSPETEGFALYNSHEEVSEKYLDTEVLGYEYISEGDGNYKHDTLWIDVKELRK